MKKPPSNGPSLLTHALAPPHPVHLPLYSPKQIPEQNPQNNVRHLWQIGTAVITFKYYNTQKQHTALRKKHQDFKSVLFLLEKKNTKHTHFKKRFSSVLQQMLSPTFKGNSTVIFTSFFVSFLFVCLYVFSRGRRLLFLSLFSFPLIFKK